MSINSASVRSRRTKILNARIKRFGNSFTAEDAEVAEATQRKVEIKTLAEKALDFCNGQL